jgi:glutathione S-transferase
VKLYSGPLSLFTAKVRVALAEKRLDYERIEVGWSLADRYLPHHPDVVALNPRKQVPVLVDADVVVYDSTVINEYLEERYPDPPLFPTDPAGRAACRQWEADADELLFPHVWDQIEESLYPAAEGGRDPARLEAARLGIGDFFAALDKRLADRDFLCGAFSVADIGSYIHANAAASLGCPPDAGLANLAGWLQRLSARESLANETQQMQQYLAGALAGGN